MDRARLLLKRLKEQAKELNVAWDDSYQVPIGFYLPDDPSRHMQIYSEKERRRDKERALELHQTSRHGYYANNNYELLLALDDPIHIFNALNEVTNSHTSHYENA